MIEDDVRTSRFAAKEYDATHQRSLARIALLIVLPVLGACGRPPEAAMSTTPAPGAADPAQAAALVGQWRNSNGTWRFKADGGFWFMGGTTIQASPPGLAIPRSSVLQGTYAVRGATLHLTLKQHTPAGQDASFRLDGRKLTIDGEAYEQQ